MTATATAAKIVHSANETPLEYAKICIANGAQFVRDYRGFGLHRSIGNGNWTTDRLTERTRRALIKAGYAFTAL